jgi:6-phosphogluconolactonase (cycloisomerase 2 family)
MKFSKFGRISLALAASLVLAFGTQSCQYDYTVAYIYVIGSQYNEMAGYKESNDTGKLYPIPGNPISTSGSNPIRSVLLPGGRYLYVLNQGKATVQSDNSIEWADAGISLFSIGGDGRLSYQLSYGSQGFGSLRLALNATGGFLYILDQYQPGSSPSTTPASPTRTAAYPCYDSTYNVYRPAGDITAFSIDPATGRLFLVTNQQQQNAQGNPLTYFPIGCGAVDFHLSSSYLFTAEAMDPATGSTQVVYPYSVNSSGQLIQTPGGAQPVGTQDMSVIGTDATGTYIYILDNGPNANLIYTFTVGTNGLLQAISGGAAPNYAGASGMTALTTDSNSKFLYVTNTQSTGLGQAQSVISSFTINRTAGGTLQTLAPGYYGTGPGPVCIFEDPSHKYIYTANANASTIVGAQLQPTTGILKALPTGSTFPTVGTPTWCLYSSTTD